MRKYFLVARGLVIGSLSSVACAELEAGKDYAVITPALPGGTNGKVEVVEMFWYGCPHCFQFEPHIEKWKKSIPDYIEFKQIPAIFNNPVWKLHARAYYTAEVLGVTEKIHKPLFDAIHVQRQRVRSKEALEEFFELHGVTKEEFKKAFNSFAVNAKVRRAEDLSKKYQLSGVPVIIVNGKYRVEGELSGSYENMLKTASELAKQEKQKQ